MATLGQNIARKALSHVGDRESPMGSNSGEQVDKYIEYVGLTPPQPWCAAFACWIVYMVLLEMGIYTDYHPKTGSTHELLKWGEDHGCVVTTPQSGDVGCIIYDATHGHTVICVGLYNSDNVQTVEGNFGDKVANNHRRIGSAIWVRPYKVPGQ